MTTLQYWRWRGERSTAVRCVGLSGLSGDSIVVDLHGEETVTPLRDRLLALESISRPSRVLFRGVSPFLREQLEGRSGEHELEERFGDVSAYIVEPHSHIERVRLGSDRAGDSTDAQLLNAARQGEIEGMLVAADALWGDDSYHFVLPSDAHSSIFAKFGDALASYVDVTRIADWIPLDLQNADVLVADNHTILPIVQELAHRAVRRRVAPPHLRVLSVHRRTDDSIAARLAECSNLVADGDATISVLQSVAASGKYRDRIVRIAESVGLDLSRRVAPLLSVGSEAVEGALAHVPAAVYATAETCALCRSQRSTPIRIDSTKFQPVLGPTVLALPRVSEMRSDATFIAEAVEHDAITVHATDPVRGRHLAVRFNSAALLNSETIRSASRVTLKTLCRGENIDCILIPEHEATESLASLAREVCPHASVFRITGINSFAIARDTVRASRRILIVDDAIISGRTILSLFEWVQAEKAAISETSFHTFGFATLARMSSSARWKGLRDRFYVGGEHRLEAAWQLLLPDDSSQDSPRCPWCAELSTIEYLSANNTADQSYLKERRERLSSPSGLTSQIFLASEVPTHEEGGWQPMLNTSSGSYYGNLNDVGAFVGALAAIQRMRDEWRVRHERFWSTYSIPLAGLLRRFTDPVLAAAFLRAVDAREVAYIWDSNDLRSAVDTITHDSQHPGLACELLLALADGKVPYSEATQRHLDRLGTLPAHISAGIGALVASRVPINSVP